MHGGGATQDLNSREKLAMYMYINHRKRLVKSRRVSFSFSRITTQNIKIYELLS